MKPFSRVNCWRGIDAVSDLSRRQLYEVTDDTLFFQIGE